MSEQKRLQVCANSSKYYHGHREMVLEKARLNKIANPEKAKRNRNEYYQRHREHICAQMKASRSEVRREILNQLGNKCAWCGFDDVRALDIDHVRNNGAKHRKRSPSSNVTYYRGILKNIDSGDYQLLCCNCNRLKHCEFVAETP